MFRAPKTMPSVSTPASSSSTPAPQRKCKQSKKCSYEFYECPHQCLDDFSYCLKHILEEPSAPFRQCSFIYNSNGRKCINPAPNLDKRDAPYCAEHTRKAQQARIKSQSKHTLPLTPEVLLLNLTHYAKSDSSKVEDDKNSRKPLDPFTEIDATKVNAKGCEILDYASSSDSDVEPTVTSDSQRGMFLDDSDNESFHNPQEDLLKHAGILTAEEIVYTTREKLIRLQSLYIEQFKRLQYTLREKRRRYLHGLKKEKETLCSIHDQLKESAKEKKIYEKLKALNRYHRRSGEEAILYRKSLEKRAKATEGAPPKPPSVPKCIFTEGGVKCGERTLPSAKHCKKHILSDQNQVLFKACNAVRADIECHEPVPIVFDLNCVYHMDLPTHCKLEPMKFDKKSFTQSENPSMDIDVVGDTHEIDPDDDMAGIMREMNDNIAKNPACHSESINSETSTDTAFSLNAQSDRDELNSV